MSKIRNFFIRQKIRFLLKKVSRLFYSDNFSLSTEEDREKFINRITNNKNKTKLLATYLAVQFVTKNISYQHLYEPLDDNAALEIIKKVDEYTKHSTIKELSQEYESFIKKVLKLYYLEAEINLRRASRYLVNGREAYKQDPYSFEGMRYIRERNNKRPLSIKEQRDCKESANELIQLDKQVKEAKEEYEDAMSKLKAQAALDKIIQEVKERKQFEEESNE